MENYIVRIYRRDQNDPEKVQGMLESVEQETQQPFQTLSALKTLLTSFAPSTASTTDGPNTKSKRSAMRFSLAK